MDMCIFYVDCQSNYLKYKIFKWAAATLGSRFWLVQGVSLNEGPLCVIVAQVTTLYDRVFARVRRDFTFFVAST